MIRSYRPSDKTFLIELIRLNTPKYFALAEQADFEDYLENKLEDYFVVEQDDEIVGCGGINYDHNNATAIISWDMIHPNFHGQGIGKSLLQFRIDKIKSASSFHKIIVRTSQYAYIFYEKSGFKLLKIEEDYWAEGLHLYVMEI